MPPPSALAISTSSVRRLLKEEASYHKELVDQESSVRGLEEKIRNGQAGEDGNDEYMLKQQVRDHSLSLKDNTPLLSPLQSHSALTCALNCSRLQIETRCRADQSRLRTSEETNRRRRRETRGLYCCGREEWWGGRRAGAGQVGAGAVQSRPEWVILNISTARTEKDNGRAPEWGGLDNDIKI